MDLKEIYKEKNREIQELMHFKSEFFEKQMRFSNNPKKIRDYKAVSSVYEQLKAAVEQINKQLSDLRNSYYIQRIQQLRHMYVSEDDPVKKEKIFDLLNQPRAHIKQELIDDFDYLEL